MATTLPQDFFELFGMEARFALDVQALERAYKDIQAAVHPDRFAGASDAERRASMQWATHVNEAYQSLRDPIKRAVYLLKRHGADPQLETDTGMAQEFLVQQMRWREEIEEAADSGDAGRLDRLSSRLGADLERVYSDLRAQLDERGDLAAAAQSVRELMFLERLGREIAEAQARLEE